MSATLALRQALMGRADTAAADLSSIRAQGSADRVGLKHVLADAQDFLAEARRWFAKAYERLDALGHPPGVDRVPALASLLRAQCDELYSLVPVLRVVVNLVDSVDGQRIADGTDVVEGLIASVSRVREALSQTDIDALEQESRVAFDRAFASLPADPELLGGADADSGPRVSVSLDALLDQVDRP